MIVSIFVEMSRCNRHHSMRSKQDEQNLAPNLAQARHIMIIFHDFSVGGTEIIALRLACEWLRHGLKVTLVCGSEKGTLRQTVPSGIEVIALNPEVTRSTFSRLKMRKHLPAAIDAIAPDVVFLPGNFHLILAGAVKRCHRRPKIIVKISNPLFRKTNFALVRKFNAFCFSSMVKHVDWLVAMSSGLEQDAREASGTNKISTIYDPNCVGTPASTSRIMPHRSEQLNILAVGRLERQKDFSLAIRAFAELVKKRSAHLTILGEGNDRTKLEKLVDTLGLAEYVSMPGYRKSIQPALAKAHLMLITSRYEGGPAVAVEALEQGVPVISTDCSYFLRELLHKPEYGCLVDGRHPSEIADKIDDFAKKQSSIQFNPAVATTRYQMQHSILSYIALFNM